MTSLLFAVSTDDPSLSVVKMNGESGGKLTNDDEFRKKAVRYQAFLDIGVRLVIAFGFTNRTPAIGNFYFLPIVTLHWARKVMVLVAVRIEKLPLPLPNLKKGARMVMVMVDHKQRP